MKGLHYEKLLFLLFLQSYMVLSVTVRYSGPGPALFLLESGEDIEGM